MVVVVMYRMEIGPIGPCRGRCAVAAKSSTVYDPDLEGSRNSQVIAVKENEGGVMERKNESGMDMLRATEDSGIRSDGMLCV